MTDATDHGPLGASVQYLDRYAPELLHPIPRREGREALGLTDDTFYGVDIWNAYEVSWLNPRGKPEVACASFRFPADSPNIIESKSFKLYLNSFNQEPMDSARALQLRLQQDLREKAGAGIEVELHEPGDWLAQLAIRGDLDERCLDNLDVAPQRYQPSAELLRLRNDGADLEERIYSNLLRSRCPVTGQPDWASVHIHYSGAAIDHEGLLLYLISFRDHDDFHEHCIERIFRDIRQRCAPAQLSVYGRYLRRGGLDINPMRSTAPIEIENGRQPRQ